MKIDNDNRSSLVHVPVRSVDGWRRLHPARHWKTGYSAKALAHSWQAADGFPAEVKDVLAQVDSFLGIRPLLIIPEHRVGLPPDGGRPSQNDVWTLARTGSNLVSIAVEGKVQETFGSTLGEWKPDASKGQRQRYDYLCGLLEVSPSMNIRYQLLHRTASALIEAQRFRAKQAVMLVHSFSQEDMHLTDYQDFLALFGIAGDVNEIMHAGRKHGGIDLYLGWARGDSQYLLC